MNNAQLDMVLEYLNEGFISDKLKSASSGNVKRTLDKFIKEGNYQAAKNYLLKRGCKKVVVLATQDIDYYKNLGYSVHKYYLQFELPL